MTHAELLAKYRPDGDRYAAALHDFLIDLQPGVVVETGFGVSTLFILAALDAMNRGQLYSVDPKPWFPHEIEHPRLELIRARSVDALGPLYARSGWWDLFLHDGNHEVEGQTFDLEFGFQGLREDGWIVCDDWSWGTHEAWPKFLRRHGLTQIVMGSVAMTQKPAGRRWIHRYEAEEVARQARELATAAKLAYTGPTHPAFEGS